MKNRNTILSVMLAFLVVLGTIHLGAVQAPAAPKGVMKIANHWTTAADWLDPSLNGGTSFGLLPLMFYHDALLKAMPDGFFSPCLAESWTNSPDFKVYEFKLRKGVKFHNGDEMTAEEPRSPRN